MRRFLAGDFVGKVAANLCRAGWGACAKAVRCRITLWRLAFTSLGDDAPLCMAIRFSTEKASSRVRWNGPINSATSNACSALNPRGKNLGRDEPARSVPEAVDARIPYKGLRRDGWKLERSACSHSSIILFVFPAVR